jgi:hypothetical protein
MSTQIRTEISVMAPPDERCMMRYAVIEAIQSQGGRERFALSYVNEASLRALLAPTCIVETGFLSREEALAVSGTPISVAA